MIRIFVFAVALTAIASPVLAQSRTTTERSLSEAEARALFDAGFAAYEAGHYEDALAHFQRAYDRSGRPALLFNVGQCHDRLRQDEQAIESFERYLAELPDAENRVQVEARIRALREGIARRAAAADPGPVVPTPAEVAAQAEPADAAPQPSPIVDANPRRGRRIALITTGAVVVVAAVVLAVLFVRDDGVDFHESDVGTVFALGGGRR